MMTLELARTIIAGTLRAAREGGMQPLAVIVLDLGSHVTAFEREDGASNMRFAIAHGKAFTAAAVAFGGALIRVPGGVLVADGTVIGAVGVSGDTSDNDEAAAVAGIEAAGIAAMTG